jgi:hypothetical protein
VNTRRCSAGTTVAIRMRDIAHSWSGSTSNPRRGCYREAKASGLSDPAAPI